MVPTGRAQQQDLLLPEEVENVFARIYRMAQEVPFKIKTTEAQHYRRYVLQQRRTQSPDQSLAEGVPGILPINEGKGFMFISHVGEVQPSGFLPVCAGNVRKASVADIYRNSELLKRLRDSSNLNGKCGHCEFKEVCGGSRARAYAVEGDLFTADPSCAYRPRKLRQEAR